MNGPWHAAFGISHPSVVMLMKPFCEICRASVIIGLVREALEYVCEEFHDRGVEELRNGFSGTFKNTIWLATGFPTKRSYAGRRPILP